eukprot:scaffold159932_cov46-Attheya_sp.AAC.1
MPASLQIAMEEDGTNALLPRNSAIAISFFYCRLPGTVNHPTEQDELYLVATGTAVASSASRSA